MSNEQIRVLKKNAIRAYKVFNPDWTCRGFQYVVGNTYKHEGEVKLCSSGFHACERLSDCFSYYNFSPNNKVAEVLLWGTIRKDTGIYNKKIVASNIRIIKELEWITVLSLCNTGNWNTGNGNTGNRNTGNWNTGGCNTGNRNTGNWNTGDWNTGDCNTGYRNTGNWNTGNWNTGSFNRTTPETILVFEKPCSYSLWMACKKPSFLFFELAEWICESSMSESEKRANPLYKTQGGYLKRYAYHEAFRRSFESAKASPDWQEQIELLKALPNFDMDIFCEISGISPKELEG